MSILPKLTREQAAEFADFFIETVKEGTYDQYRTFRQVKEAMMIALEEKGKKGERLPSTAEEREKFIKDVTDKLGFDGEKVQISETQEPVLRENLINHLTGRTNESWDTGDGGDWRIREIFHNSGIDLEEKNIFGFEGRIGIHHTSGKWEAYVNYQVWHDPLSWDKQDVHPLENQDTQISVNESANTPQSPRQIGAGQPVVRPPIIGTREV